MQPNIFSNQDFKTESIKRIEIIINCFTKKEVLTIMDFINTASNLSDKELEEIHK